MSNANASAPANRLALVFIMVTLVVDMIGFGIVIPVAPKIIMQLTGDGLSDAATWGGWLSFTFALMLFLCAPLIGNISDRFGRRPVIIASLVAIGIDYAITGWAPTIYWLFIGRFLSGMAGASYTTAYAYIADITPPEKRAVNFGLVGAAFSLGFVVGPWLGGVLGDINPRLPFFFAAGMAGLNALFGLFVLRESLPAKDRRTFELWRANPLGALMALRRFPGIAGMIGMLVLIRLAHDANPSIWAYYTMLKFHWSIADVGNSMMFIGVVLGINYIFTTRWLIPRIGEVRATYVSLAAGAVGFAGYAFATQGWMMYAWMAVWSLMALSMPALNAIMSKQVGPSEQGELQGALSSVGGLTSVVAPPLLTGLFAWFTGPSAPVFFPGAAFLAGGVFLALALLWFTQLRPLDDVPVEAAEVQEG